MGVQEWGGGVLGLEVVGFSSKKVKVGACACVFGLSVQHAATATVTIIVTATATATAACVCTPFHDHVWKDEQPGDKEHHSECSKQAQLEACKFKFAGKL